MYLVIDSETNTKNKGDAAIGKFKGDPFSPHNHAVYWGWKRNDGIVITTDGTKFCGEMDGMTHQKVELLVGHNIKFDLHYMWKDTPDSMTTIYKQGIQLWDTQLAEYLITGQEHKWASLDQLSGKYGGTLKDSRIKEYWDAGLDTEDIPREEITPYLEQDVLNTERVFLSQIKIAYIMGLMPLIMSQMEGLLATAMMEWNGMAFDKKLALRKSAEMSRDIDKLCISLTSVMERSRLVGANPSSNKQVGLYLFGGVHTFKERVAIIDADGNKVLFKSGAKKGKIRTKIQDISIEIKPMTTPKPEWRKTSGWSVDNEVLETLAGRTLGGTSSPLRVFITLLVEYRALTKDVKTYYVGFSKLTWSDGIIHGHFNHCNTHTGRLSSSAPNLQNVTRK